MSLVSEQIQKLRDLANDPEIDMYGIKELNDAFKEAADTIELLSTKLASANMERSSAYYNGGWIPCSDGNLPEKEVLCCDKYGEIMFGYVFKAEEGTYNAESDNEYIYDCVAWMPKPEPYKE